MEKRHEVHDMILLVIYNFLKCLITTKYLLLFVKEIDVIFLNGARLIVHFSVVWQCCPHLQIRSTRHISR